MKLSSSLTWVYKFIFPLHPIVFTVVGLSLIQEENIIGYCFLGIGLIIGFYYIPYAIKMTEVWIEGEFLIVSNFKNTVKIPFSNIANVEEDTSINIHPIKIHLKESCDFGMYIHFIPNGCQIFSESKSYELIKEKIKRKIK
jgi:hypothetical protein